MPAADIVIQGSRIVALSATGSGQAPPDARVLDASGKTVIPGIINLRGLAGLVRSPERTAAPFSRTEIARQLRIYASYGVTTTTTLGPPAADLTDFRSTVEAGSTPPVARTLTPLRILTSPNSGTHENLLGQPALQSLAAGRGAQGSRCFLPRGSGLHRVPGRPTRASRNPGPAGTASHHQPGQAARASDRGACPRPAIRGSVCP